MSNDIDTINQDELSRLLIDTVNQGTSLKDIHRVSDEMMDNLYAHAYQFYQQGRLDDAERFFSFLSMYDLNNADYFIGLGAVNQLKKKYQKACDFYSLAYVIADNNFYPVFYSGQCHLLLGQAVKAMQCFELIVKRCEDSKLVEQSRLFLETIRSNLKDDGAG